MEGKQAEYMAELVERAANLNGAELTTVIIDATSHSSIFSFSEILSVPNIRELQGTENSNYLDLLCIFAYGTWSDYKDAVSHLPLLDPEQILKLKQLTVLTLAETRMVPYDTLMQELDISNVHELEDFLITNCIYVGIITGRLDHMKRCFKVQVAAGRDIEIGQLDILVQNLESWLVKSDHLLTSIEENIIAAESKHEMQCKHKKELNQTSSFKADNKARQRQGEEKALLDLAQVLDIGQLLVSMKRKRIQRRL